MVVLVVITVLVALIAFAALILALILSGRLRRLGEVIAYQLPLTTGLLPPPGTRVGPFATTATNGELVNEVAFASGERIMALLSTGCGDCKTQVAAFAKLGRQLQPPAVVGVIGPAADRAPMVAELAGHVTVLEEAAFGPVAEAFQISEFPAVLLVRDGRIEAAAHELAQVLDLRAARAS